MKLKYEIETIDIGGDTMVVPIDSSDEFRGVLHINETTRDIIEILKKDVTEDEIISAMKNIYDATDEDIRRNVQKVLDTLRQYKLLEE